MTQRQLPSKHQKRDEMAVTLHTSLGDLKLEIFCDTTPRTAFNFLALCASGYYDGEIALLKKVTEQLCSSDR